MQKEVRKERKLQPQELEEIQLQVYENFKLYKKVKNYHDKRTLKDFYEGKKVLLFNSKLKLMNGKLRSKWDG